MSKDMQTIADQLGDALRKLACKLEEEKAKQAKEQAEGERLWRAQQRKKHEQASTMPYQHKAFLWK